jgi:hypothetical protein
MSNLKAQSGRGLEMALPGRSIQEAVIVVILGFLIGTIFSAIVYYFVL